MSAALLPSPTSGSNAQRKRQHAIEAELASTLGEFGWTSINGIDASLVLDGTAHEHYGAGRAWSNAESYALTGVTGRIYLLHVVEGSFTVTVDDQVFELGAGQLVVLDGRVPASISAPCPTARYLWHFDPVFLAPSHGYFRFNHPVNVAGSPMSALVSMTNSILNAGAPTTPSAISHVGVALEHFAAAALRASTTKYHGEKAAHRDGLVMAAQLVIESHFRDPSFHVGQLVTELSTSSSQLHAAFSELGTTPRREIVRRRLTEADRLQAQVLTTTQVVYRSGFTSMRQYRQASARFTHRT